MGEPTARGRVAVVEGPAAGLVGDACLLGHELVAVLHVPPWPDRVVELHERLREIEVLVDGLGGGAWLGKRGEAAVESLLLRAPAGIHSAEQADRRRAWLGGRAAVAVGRAIQSLHAVEKPSHAVDRRRGSLEAGELRTFQRGQLPGSDRGVASLAGQIPPAAAVHILGCLNEADGVANRRHEHVVFRHAERFGQGQRRHAVAVHVALAEVAAAGRALHPAK